MLDGVIIQMAINRLEQEISDLLPDDRVSEVLVEAEIGKIPAALSVEFQVLCILQHVNHEVDCVMGGHHGVAVKDLRDVSKACRSVELGLVVTSLLAELHDCLDDVGFDTVILDLV